MERMWYRLLQVKEGEQKCAMQTSTPGGTELPSSFCWIKFLRKTMSSPMTFLTCHSVMLQLRGEGVGTCVFTICLLGYWAFCQLEGAGLGTVLGGILWNSRGQTISISNINITRSSLCLN